MITLPQSTPKAPAATLTFDDPALLLFHLKEADRLCWGWWRDQMPYRDRAVVPVIDLFDNDLIIGAATWHTTPSGYAWMFSGRDSISEFHFYDEIIPLMRTREGWTCAGDPETERLTIHAAARRADFEKLNSEPGFSREDTVIDLFKAFQGAGR